MSKKVLKYRKQHKNKHKHMNAEYVWRNQTKTKGREVGTEIQQAHCQRHTVLVMRARQCYKPNGS